MDWMKWITDDVRDERREELFKLGFEWEVNNSDQLCRTMYSTIDTLGHYLWETVPDVLVWYGLDYFIERDLVH